MCKKFYQNQSEPHTLGSLFNYELFLIHFDKWNHSHLAQYYNIAPPPHLHITSNRTRHFNLILKYVELKTVQTIIPKLTYKKRN